MVRTRIDEIAPGILREMLETMQPSPQAAKLADDLKVEDDKNA